MINYKVGDLIKAAQGGEVNVIAHCCNCYNTMGAGIAKQIRYAWPGAYDVDQSTIRGDKLKLGSFTAYYDVSGVTIYNLYGQYSYGRTVIDGYYILPIDYNALKKALISMTRDIMHHHPSFADIKVGFPLIGCGLAGGNWAEVSDIIEIALGDFSPTVYVTTQEDYDKYSEYWSK